MTTNSARRRAALLNLAGRRTSAGGPPGHAIVRAIDVLVALGLDAEHIAWAAHKTFKLDGGVLDVELVRQDLADLGKDVLRLCDALILDQEMCTHRTPLRAERPDVQIVEVTHAGNAAHRADYRISLQV